ncbi:MAG: hypothetical protein N3D12_03985 [Candidatus Methanomethyliaceae archaeon]|nr:hypothetical protein [Candidatus Methanomethyliaceae archaeon]
MSYIQRLRAKILLLTISLFYDVTFIDRIWTDPELSRAYVGLAGLLIAGVSGVLYSVECFLSIPVSPLPYSTAILVGALMFLVGGFGRRIRLTFDTVVSRENILSRGTMLCLVSDTKQSSSIIELLIFSISQWDEDRLTEAEPFLIFAHEIWRESLMRKGLSIIGQVPLPKDLASKIKFLQIDRNKRTKRLDDQ